MLIASDIMAGSIPLGLSVLVAAVSSNRAKPADGCSTCGSREQLLASLLERIPDVVLLLDAEGRVRYANAAGRLSRLGPEDELFRSDLIHPEDAETIARCWARVRHMPSQPLSAEIRIRRDDDWVRMIVTAENLLADPAIAAVLVTATDATRQKEMAWRLQQAQRLEAVGRLAGGVAHDFNNFLTTIQGLTSLCLDDPTLSRETREDLTEVSSAATRAATVTRRLLAFSRRQVLRPQGVDLNAHVRDASQSIGGLIGEDVLLTATTDARDARVVVDPSQLEQVLLALALNARDAMPQGGLLSLRTSEVVIDAGEAGRLSRDLPPGDYVLLEVSDSGPGIPAHLRDVVFEPFYTTKTTDFGSGLGLSTVYGIVKQSGGHVWIGEAASGGALISILLPHGRALNDTEQPMSPGVARQGGTVLIAEDDPALRFLARRVLAREGYTVLEAMDGAAALEICASYQGEIDLLLSDVVMPGMSGGELMVRSRVTRPDMAVLFMSGYPEDAIVRNGANGCDLIEKPFEPEALAERVRRALAAADQRRTTSSSRTATASAGN